MYIMHVLYVYCQEDCTQLMWLILFTIQTTIGVKNSAHYEKNQERYSNLVQFHKTAEWSLVKQVVSCAVDVLGTPVSFPARGERVMTRISPPSFVNRATENPTVLLRFNSGGENKR